MSLYQQFERGFDCCSLGTSAAAPHRLLNECFIDFDIRSHYV